MSGLPALPGSPASGFLVKGKGAGGFFYHLVYVDHEVRGSLHYVGYGLPGQAPALDVVEVKEQDLVTHDALLLVAHLGTRAASRSR